ncbi:hypothetical protein TNCV_2063991 [Trichonephila clavipes]|nr:hypothetical protein TNCV_2063991 [Trichonephila clavipes]
MSRWIGERTIQLLWRVCELLLLRQVCFDGLSVASWGSDGLSVASCVFDSLSAVPCRFDGLSVASCNLTACCPTSCVSSGFWLFLRGIDGTMSFQSTARKKFFQAKIGRTHFPLVMTRCSPSQKEEEKPNGVSRQRKVSFA